MTFRRNYISLELFKEGIVQANGLSMATYQHLRIVTADVVANLDKVYNIEITAGKLQLRSYDFYVIRELMTSRSVH